MDATLKAKWVEALRSGEFKQGRLYFDRYGKNCCLGVLCKVADQPAEVAPSVDNWTFVDATIQPPVKVSILVGMNDDERNTFPEIADYIEKNL